MLGLEPCIVGPKIDTPQMQVLRLMLSMSCENGGRPTRATTVTATTRRRRHEAKRHDDGDEATTTAAKTMTVATMKSS